MRREKWLIFGFICLTAAALIVIFVFKPWKKTIRIDHIYLITIDTLRADHLGCYGYPRSTSPFIDSLAKKSITFTRANAQSATTCPTHASIFTGFYPYQHKVLANGLVLDESHTTLAEILNKKGFVTAGFASTAYHFNRSKLNQGFEFYNDPIKILKMFEGTYQPARITENKAELWLSNFDHNRKLFMWLHFFDPHTPYRPLADHVRKIERSLKREDFIKYLEKIPVELSGFNNSIDQMYGKITQYDAEIRYVDEELEKFYKFVTAKKLNESALWIITADHGEGLGQHNWYLHGKLLYREAIHVPLIFHFSNKSIKPGQIDDIVGNFDIFPTVLEGLDIEIDDKLKKKIKALSLWKKITKRDSLPVHKYVFSQRRIYIKKKEYKPGTPYWDINYDVGRKYCIRDEKFKYIYNTVYPDEFYNLSEDIFELENKIDDTNLQKIKNSLKKEILKILNDAKKYKNKKIRSVKNESLEGLESLGYIL